MTKARRHIIVCDDEADIREMIGEYLEKRGYDVTLAADGGALAEARAKTDAIDAVILDINMPRDDGFTVLRKMRAESDTPVIMVTAAGDVVDRIVGLEMGADDYLAKPVDLRELDSRLKAVLRRTSATNPDDGRAAGTVAAVEVDGLMIDIEAATLKARDGSLVALTAMEFRLLRVFLEHRGRVLNRDQLLELAHDRGWDPYDRSIDIRVSRLRRKIERVPSNPQLIRTVRGVGYVFG